MNFDPSFETEVTKLLAKRNMLPKKKNVGLTAWRDYFLAFAWLAHCRHGDGFEMLSILSNDKNLITGEQFNSNFRRKFEELYPAPLRSNKTWQALMPLLVAFKGKGLGAGELYLALVIQGWTFERTDGKGDGKVAGGIRELKNNGASLKPHEDTQRRIINELNERVFQSNRPGPLNPNKNSQGQSFERFIRWFSQQSNKKEILTEYFTNLWPGVDTKALVKKLVGIKDGQEFYNTVGAHVLAQYKSIDKWDSLVVLDQENMVMVNIADPADPAILKNVKFNWMTQRGGDSQAVCDGYVNIVIY
jgi:hypothetical protein